MKTRLVYLSFALVSILSLILGCNEKSSVEGNSLPIKYLSHKSSGCISEQSLSKVNAQPVINWNYRRSELKIELLFSANCVAEFKDSVTFGNDTINIFLANINQDSALCTCPFKEEFDFRLVSNEKINIIFYYKNYFNTEYSLLTETTINL